MSAKKSIRMGLAIGNRARIRPMAGWRMRRADSRRRSSCSRNCASTNRRRTTGTTEEGKIDNDGMRKMPQCCMDANAARVGAHAQ
jgi:hypothetical protein